MRITESQLRKIIRESLLTEIDPSLGRATGGHDQVFHQTHSAVQKMPPAEVKKATIEMAKAISKGTPVFAEIAAGFTPAGVAIDVKDMKVAIDKGDYCRYWIYTWHWRLDKVNVES